MSGPVTLTVDTESLVAALAAFNLASSRARRYGAPDLAERFQAAHDDFHKAYSFAIDFDTEVMTPALLRRQI